MESNKIENSPFYKIIIYGDEKVGKTQLINALAGIPFQEQYYPTFGVDFKIIKYNYNNKLIEIQLIDTAGLSSNSIDLSKKFIKRTDAYIIVFDLTDLNSLEHIDYYIDKFYNYKTNSDKLIYLVGNKYDINQYINSNFNNIINEKKEKYNAKFIKVSAKIYTNIKELFFNVIKDITDKKNFCYDFKDFKDNDVSDNNIKYKIKSYISKEKLNKTYGDKLHIRTFSNKITNASTLTEDKFVDSKKEEDILPSTSRVVTKKEKCCPIF